MKKITLLIALAIFSFCWQSNAQISEDFEVDPPTGWTFYQTEGDDPGFVQTDSRAYSGTYSYYHNDDNIASESTSWMVSPSYAVSLGDILSLYYNHNYYPDYSVESGIWISTSSADPITNPGDFTEIYDLDANGSEDAWTLYSQSLDTYDGQTVYVAIKYVGDWADELFIDDFYMGPPPSCPVPSALTVSNMMGTTAELGWTDNAGASLWDVELVDITGGGSTTGAPTATGVTNPYTAMSLVSGNDYEFSVRADCGGDGTSEWVGPFAFTFYPEPDCPIGPVTPADGATDVPTGDITFSWSAPASGPTPTGYNVYQVDDATGANPDLIGTYTETSTVENLIAYGVTVYWMVTSLNGTSESSSCAIYSFTTEPFPGYCTTYNSYSPYPATAYTNSVCDGTVENIETGCWAGEYSLVNVVSGNEYVFSSSEPDLITITADVDSDAPLASGSGSATWLATFDGVVRFYTHLDDNACGFESVGRTRSVSCDDSLGVLDAEFSGFTYYPNPVNDKLSLNAQSNIQNVTVYNMLGQEVINASPNALDTQVDMANLNSGAYFVKVTIDNATKTIRVIKK